MSTNEATVTGEWARRDREVVLHPWLEADVAERTVIVRGKGSTVWDDDGQAYLDAESCAWLANIGHGRPELAHAARTQALECARTSVGSRFTSAPAVRLAQRLVDKAPAGIGQVRYASCGSEADDNALRYARLFHAHRGEPDRTWILSLDGCFHGRCYSGAALQGFTADAGLGPMLPHVRSVIAPLPRNEAVFGETDPTDYCIAALREVIAEIGAGNIAGLFAEPVMAGPGMVDLPVDYWPRVAEVLKENGILLIFDEVVTAFGRCGDWFAANLYGVSPDLIVVAKGIAGGYVPLGAVLLSEDVARALEGVDDGDAVGGHPVACAVANANLDILESEGLIERSAQLGAWLRSELAAELADSPVVARVTGQGMMLGVHLRGVEPGSESPVAEGVIDALLEHEYHVLAMYYHGSINLVPPLVLTDVEAAELVAAVVALVRRLHLDGTVDGLHDGAAQVSV